MQPKTYISAVLGTGQWERGWYAFHIYRYKVDGTQEEIYLSGFTHKTPEEAVEQGITWCDNNGYDNPTFITES